MQFAMMRAAQRDGEFIAHLLPQSAELRKAQMVRVAGLSAADEAGLFGDKAQVLLVPQPPGFGWGHLRPTGPLATSYRPRSPAVALHEISLSPTVYGGPKSAAQTGFDTPGAKAWLRSGLAGQGGRSAD